MVLKAPFPYFGGKSKIATIVWDALGEVRNYVEPFFGSGACLLAAPWPSDRIETVNDKDGMVANFWRALQADPDAVSHYADWPVNENDLHARHYWLLQQRESLQARLEGDPDYYDAKVAGWWVWGMSAWIGRDFCSGSGPWTVVNGEMVKGDSGQGINRQMPHLGDAGQGINRKNDLKSYLSALSQRLRKVRVCCGDWSRVCGPSPTYRLGLTGVFLDPPYSEESGRKKLYLVDEMSISHQVRQWAIDNGDNPLMRIVLCGYECEHEMPDTWTMVAWETKGGYSNQNKKFNNTNRYKERIWLSLHCLKKESLFEYQTDLGRYINEGQGNFN